MEINLSRAAMIEHASFGIPIQAISYILSKDIKMQFTVWVSMSLMEIEYARVPLIKRPKYGILSLENYYPLIQGIKEKSWPFLLIQTDY